MESSESNEYECASPEATASKHEEDSNHVFTQNGELTHIEEGLKEEQSTVDSLPQEGVLNQKEIYEEVLSTGEEYIEKHGECDIVSEKESISEENQTSISEENQTKLLGDCSNEKNEQGTLPKEIVHRQREEIPDTGTQTFKDGYTLEGIQKVLQEDFLNEHSQNVLSEEGSCREKFIEDKRMQTDTVGKKISDEMECFQEEGEEKIIAEGGSVPKEICIEQGASVSDLDRDGVGDVGDKEDGSLHNDSDSLQKEGVVEFLKESNDVSEVPLSEDHEISKERLADQMVQDPEPINVEEIEAIQRSESNNHDYNLPDSFYFNSDEKGDKNSDNLSSNFDEFLHHLSDDPSNEKSKEVDKDDQLSKSVHDPEIPFQYLEVYPDCRDPVADNEYETTIDVYGEHIPSHLKNYLKKNDYFIGKMKTEGSYDNDGGNVNSNDTKNNKSHENIHDAYTVGSQMIIKELNAKDGNENDKDCDNSDINNNECREKSNYQQPESYPDIKNEIDEFTYDGNNMSPLEFDIEENEDSSLPSPLRVKLEEATSTSEIDLFDYLPQTTRINQSIIKDENVNDKQIFHDYNEAAVVENSSMQVSKSFSEQICYQNYTESFAPDFYHSQIQMQPVGHNSAPDVSSFHSQAYQQSSGHENQDYHYGGSHYPMNMNPTTNNSLSFQRLANNESSDLTTNHNLSEQVSTNNDSFNQPSTSDHLCNQPKEILIPSISYPSIALGFPQPLPVIYPCEVGHMAPPPIVFPPIPLKFPYGDPIQSTLPTWLPDTRFPEPEPLACYRIIKNPRMLVHQDSENSNIKMDNSKFYLPNVSFPEADADNHVEKCNAMSIYPDRGISKIRIENSKPNVINKKNPDPDTSNQNENCHILSMNPESENSKNEMDSKSDLPNHKCTRYYYKKYGKYLPCKREYCNEIYLRNFGKGITNDSSDEDVNAEMSNQSLGNDSVDIKNYDTNTCNNFDDKNVNSTEFKKFCKYIPNLSSLSGKQAAVQPKSFDKPTTSQIPMSLHPSEILKNQKRSIDNLEIFPINPTDKKCQQVIERINITHWNVLKPEKKVLSLSKDIVIYKNIPDIELKGTTLVNKVSTGEKDKCSINLTGNNNTDYSNDNVNYNGHDSNKKVTECIDLTLDDDKAEQTQQISTNCTLQFAPINHSQLVDTRTSEDLKFTVRKRGRPKGSKTSNTIKRVRMSEVHDILRPSQVHRIQKHIPILPKGDLSANNMMYTRQAHKKEVLSQYSNFSAYSPSTSVVHQYPWKREFVDKQQSKGVSNISVLNITNKSKESNWISSKNNIVCVRTTRSSKKLENQSNSETLGSIAPMEAKYSEKVAMSKYVNQEDDSNCHIGQSQRTYADGFGNISGKIPKAYDKFTTNLPEKDNNGNFIMVLNSKDSFNKGKNIMKPYKAEGNTDSHGYVKVESLQPPYLKRADEVSNSDILRLLDSESIPQVDQKKFCLATIDLMKQFRVIQVNQNVAKPENKRTIGDRIKESETENPYKKVYKERVREKSSRGRTRLSCVENKGYQDAYMKFLYE